MKQRNEEPQQDHERELPQKKAGTIELEQPTQQKVHHLSAEELHGAAAEHD